MFNRKFKDSVTKIEKYLEIIKVNACHTNTTTGLINAEQDIIIEKIDAVNNKLDALTKDLWGMYNIFLEKNYSLTNDVERVEQRACELIDLNKNLSEDIRKEISNKNSKDGTYEKSTIIEIYSKTCDEKEDE